MDMSPCYHRWIPRNYIYTQSLCLHDKIMVALFMKNERNEEKTIVSSEKKISCMRLK